MSPSKPTARQLAYLRSLAESTGTSFTYPKTRQQASREIVRLRNLKPEMRRNTLEDDTPAQAAQLTYAAAPSSEEITGYGSSAHWATTTVKDPEQIPATSRVGERVELARYRISSGERVIYGQRISGRVRLTDRPADGRGRSFMVESDLQLDGNDAINGLIGDYIEQAGELDSVPMLTRSRRRD
jgi:hypothetical protein